MWLLLALALPSPNDGDPAPRRSVLRPRARTVAAAPERPTPEARTLGELGESCRAALDCRPEFRCTDRMCVPRPEPKADDAPPKLEPKTTSNALRATVELRGGWAYNHRAQRDLLRGDRTARESHHLTGDALVGLELGLADDQLLIGAQLGLAAPSGFDGWEPTAQAELRAGWRLWRGSPSVGLYLEPHLAFGFGDLPGSTALGGGLGLRFRVFLLDLGLSASGLGFARGPVRLDDVTVVEEELTVVRAGLFLGLTPRLATW